MHLHLFSGGGLAMTATVVARAADRLAGVPHPVIGWIPAASVDPPGAWLDYMTQAFAPVGTIRPIDLDLADAASFAADIAACDAVFVPGGNTYLLSKRMHRHRAMGTLSEAVRGGVPLLTRSAGTVFCGPNMLTTNDWNVFGTTEFDALGLSPYNFNVHFTLPPEDEPESRDFRIRQYVTVNRRPVLALEETCNLEWTDSEVRVHDATCWLYTTSGERRPLPPGSTFSPSLGG